MRTMPEDSEDQIRTEVCLTHITVFLCHERFGLIYVIIGSTTNATRNHSNAMLRTALVEKRALVHRMTLIGTSGVCTLIARHLVIVTFVRSAPVKASLKFGLVRIISKPISNVCTRRRMCQIVSLKVMS